MGTTKLTSQGQCKDDIHRHLLQVGLYCRSSYIKASCLSYPCLFFKKTNIASPLGPETLRWYYELPLETFQGLKVQHIHLQANRLINAKHRYLYTHPVRDSSFARSRLKQRAALAQGLFEQRQESNQRFLNSRLSRLAISLHQHSPRDCTATPPYPIQIIGVPHCQVYTGAEQL